MDASVIENIVDICAILMLLISVLAVASTRMRRIVQMFAAQSFVLGIIGIAVGYYTNNWHIYIISALTFVLKAYAIPKFLDYTMDKINMEKEIDPIVGIPGSLLVCSAMVFIAYLVVEPMIGSIDTLGRSCLAISLSVVFIGMFMMVARRKALTESVGLLLMENGLFLGAMTISYGMPLIVEFGIFFDVIIAVIIIGIFAYRINRTFNSVDTSFMRRLKD